MPNTVKLVEIDHVREKLVELIDDALQREEGTARVVGKRYVNTIADHLIDHSVTVQEWISVKDRLPSMDEKCLLCIESRITKYRWVVIGYYHTNYDGYVTHWMPLPEPPKGE